MHYLTDRQAGVVWEQWSGIDYVDAAAAAAAAARTDSAACGRADDGNSCLGSDDRGRAAGGTTGITALLADRRFPFEPTSRRIVTDEALLGVYDQRAAAGPGSSSRSGGGGGGGELVGARMSAWFYTDDADNSGSGSTCCYTFSLSTRAGAAAAAEVRKRDLSSTVVLKTIILPRQALDKQALEKLV
jgi:hypothetical protein